MPLLGTTEIILIVVVLILIFGATRLPKLAKALGQSRQAFRAGLKEADEEIPQKEKGV
jgi:sec-independent protein translocase protein TatA